MYGFNEEFHHTQRESIEQVMQLTEQPGDMRLIQLGALWGKLDERGKQTILALAASQAKLCSKQ